MFSIKHYLKFILMISLLSSSAFAKNIINSEQQSLINKRENSQVKTNAVISDTLILPSIACDSETQRMLGKIDKIYWVEGSDNKPVDDEITHYVEASIIVQTSGYKLGDCIKVEISSSDGDLAVGVKEIVLFGEVNADNLVFFKEPLRNYSIIISNN